MSYASEVLADSPVSYWRLAETVGTTATDEQATYNGTYTGGYTLAQTGPVPSGSAVALNGTSGYINTSASPLDTIGTGDFTLEAWVYNTDQTTVDYIITKDSASGRQFMFGLQEQINSGTIFAGKLQIVIVKTGAADYFARYTASSAVSANAWHHVVARRLSGVLSLWVDGSSVSTTSGTIGSGTEGMAIAGSTPSKLQIGAREYVASENYFAGSVAEPAVYTTALSDARILAHYQAGATLAPTLRTVVGTGRW